jgi:hypothetical protein
MLNGHSQGKFSKFEARTPIDLNPTSTGPEYTKSGVANIVDSALISALKAATTATVQIIDAAQVRDSAFLGDSYLTLHDIGQTIESHKAEVSFILERTARLMHGVFESMESKTSAELDERLGLKLSCLNEYVHNCAGGIC